MTVHEEDFAACNGPRRLIEEQCIQCGMCLKQCAFLQRYGDPKTIAQWLVDGSASHAEKVAFECSLCGLCAAVCPKDLNAGAMALDLRRKLVLRGKGVVRAHGRLLAYERRGSSSRFAHHRVPPGCDTVVFPGCALAGTRSRKVFQLYDLLGQVVPDLGIVLDCCTKPSHDLGRMDHFLQTFGVLRESLLKRGVRRVLTACPSCHDVFQRYGGDLSVQTVYEVLAEREMISSHTLSGVVTIHDPCATRFEGAVHEAVRGVVTGLGLTVREMKHRGRKTLCCGEGGAAHFIAPELPAQWAAVRLEESQGLPVITYCAGCVDRLGRTLPMAHVLDLLFEPERALTGKVSASRAPFTYWRRLQLKKRLKQLDRT
ncbi:MAG: (Fe-S)-binding protein [Syntrophobacteraceae bacterium]